MTGEFSSLFHQIQMIVSVVPKVGVAFFLGQLHVMKGTVVLTLHCDRLWQCVRSPSIGIIQLSKFPDY